MDRPSALKCILCWNTALLSHFEIGIPLSRCAASSYSTWGHLNGADAHKFSGHSYSIVTGHEANALGTVYSLKG